MKKIFEDPVTYLIAYIVVGFITFGNAYHRIPAEEKGYFGGTEFTIHNGPGTKAAGALMSSIAWPFYWSVQIWR